MNAIRVAIADDDGLVRDGLGAILETHEDILLVGAAADGQEAVALCLRERPDVVLMDIRMPAMDGVAATKAIKAESDVKVIILTTFDDAEYIRSAIALGAEGYVLKSSPADAIVESVRAVARGHTVLQNEVAKRLGRMVDAAAASGAPGPARPAPALGLAPREHEILVLIAEGLSNKEIAAKLNLSDGTVRNYVSEMLVKLDVRDRTQLAILYYRSLR